MPESSINSETGEIWLPECGQPVRPHVSLDEFLRTFESFVTVRDAGQLKERNDISPFPICGFDRTFALEGTHFLVVLQFSDSRETPDPRLQHVRLFAKAAPWRRDASLLTRIRKRFSRNPLLVGLPKEFKSADKQRAACEKWLRGNASQSKHEQQYSWGCLKLVNLRDESYFIQLDYSD